MTISTTTSRQIYNGNGVTTVFAFPYRFLRNEDLEVYRINDSTGVVTTLALSTDYTVSGADNDAGGNVTTTVAPATGERLVIVRVVDLTQEVDYITGDPFPAETHERALDRLTMISQQLQEELDRTAKLPVTSEADANSLVADLIRVADSIDEVDTVAGSIGNVNITAANIANVNTVAGISANVTTVAGISANVTTIAGISADVTAVAGDAADIGVVAGNIGNVNTVSTNITEVVAVGSDLTGSPVVVDYGDLSAATNPATPTGAIGAVYAIRDDIQTIAGIQSNVTTVAGISVNVTTVAGINADVTTVAGISANVTTVAGISTDVSKVAAIDADVTTVAGIESDVSIVATNVADVTNFADVYQGPKTADPSTRNDGSPLQLGDLYFNTVFDEMRVYKSAGWDAAYLPAGDYLLSANNLSDLANAKAARDNLELSDMGDLT